MLKKNQGFTLIELLVVVAIIGILASVVLASLNTARTKARNVRRVADLKELRKALELYYFDNGVYPRYETGQSPTCGASGWALNYTPWDVCWADLQTKLSSYISKLPTEPVYTNSDQYHYRAQNSGAGYYIMMWPEGSYTLGEETCYDGAGGWYCFGNNWQ